MGALTFTVLLLLPGQAPQEFDGVFSQRVFRIPIDIESARRKEISRFILYVSRDEGNSWQPDTADLPDGSGFVFNAPADGVYWFRAAAINRQGKQEPDNINKVSLNQTQRVLVDTLKPIIQISSAQRQGEEIVVRWDIQEQYPDLDSLRLKYRASDAAAFLPWSAVNHVTPGLHGEAHFRPDTANPVVVRLEIKDRAGNFSYQDVAVGGALATASFVGNTGLPTGSGQVPGGLPPPAPTGIKTDVLPPPMPVTPPPPGTADRQSQTPVPPAGGQPFQMPPLPPAPGANDPQPGIQAVVPPPQKSRPVWDNLSGPSEGARNMQPIATSQGTNQKPVYGSEPVPPGMGSLPEQRKPLPRAQIINKLDVVVEYQLAKVGAGGVGAVELWMTTNDGQQWELWMDDPTVKPGSTAIGNGKYKRTLRLPREGVYGLTLVVRNRLGRGKTPRPGDVPEMRIEVDLTPPTGILFPPEVNAQRNALILTWQAEDHNLTQFPISLEWAATKTGRWETIATNLPNTGKYNWTPPPGVPPYVYLKLRVRDQAGNESFATSDEPQPADLSEPEGRLIGVVSSTEGE